MTEASVCIIVDKNKTLMHLATRGISKGRWNFPGGKVEPGETVKKSIIREVLEETGLNVSGSNYHGKLDFYFEGKKNFVWTVHIFSTKKYKGELKVGNEGEFEWIDLNALPKGQMWPGDRIWLPYVLEGRSLSGRFYFNSDGTKVLKYNLRETLRKS